MALDRALPLRGEPDTLLSQVFIPYAGAVLGAALWVRFAELPSLFRVPEDKRLLQWSVVALLVALAMVEAGALLERSGWYRDMVVWLKQMVTALLGSKIRVSDAFLVALYSSIGEEALFRGAAQPWLARLIGGLGPIPEPWPGVFIASLLFGLVHAPMVRALLPWTIAAVLMGFVFGALAVAGDCLLPAVIAHFTINFINLQRIGHFDPGLAGSSPPS